MEMEPSLFSVHRGILLSDYGGAQTLANLALSLYNGYAFPWDASSISNLDSKHIEIAVELIRSYNRNVENDIEFLAVCEEIKTQRGID